MSLSPRSKPASGTSPATGDGTDKATDDAPSGGPVEIAVELEVSRQRAATMTAFGLILGALLIWKLGTVGVWVGVVLLVVGAFRAWELAQSFLFPAGTIKVTDSQVTLPRGLCMPRPVQVAPADITAVYFLRRSVPWNRSAPVLVVEIGDRAMAFPRDWFASEADQRHVIHALMRTKPDDAGANTEDGEPAAPREQVQLGDSSRSAWGLMLGGVVLMGIGIVGTVMSKSQTGAGGQYAIYVGPMVAGFILLWRGFARW
jgi:hypothetical protein